MSAPNIPCTTTRNLDESKAAHTAGLAIVVIFPAIATVFVALRIWSRALLKSFGWDDALIVIALALSIAGTGATWTFTQVSYGGYHKCDVPPMTLSDVKRLNSWLLIQQLLYNPVLVVIKASVLLFLMRFNDNRWYIKWSLRLLFVLNAMLGIAIFFADLFQCTPVRYMYDSIAMDIEARLKAGVDPTTGVGPDGRVVHGGHCIAQNAFVLISAGITTFTEVLTLLIPMAMMWDLNTSKRKKIIVISILSLGWIVVAVSVARIVIFHTLLYPKSTDDTGYGAHNQISAVETNLAIVTACAPALKALTKRFAPRFLSSKTSNYRGPSGAAKYGYGYSGSKSRSSMGVGKFGHGTASSNGRSMPSFAGTKADRSGSKHQTTISVDSRSESQENIYRPQHNSGGIEKTVQIDIEMDDIESRKSEAGTGSARWGRGEHPVEE